MHTIKSIHPLNVEGLRRQPIARAYSHATAGRVMQIISRNLPDRSVLLGIKESEHLGEVEIATYILVPDGKIYVHNDSDNLVIGSISYDTFYMVLNPLPHYNDWVLTRDLSIHGSKEFHIIGSSLDTLDIAPHFFDRMNRTMAAYVRIRR